MTKYYHNYQFPDRINSVSKKLIIIFRLSVFVLALVFVTSCEQIPTTIGEGSLPGSDFVTIKSNDTLGVTSYTLYNKSVRTDNLSVSYFGNSYDPYFGSASASFATQIRLSSEWVTADYVVDSVNLALTLLDVKGGSGVIQTLRLSEIAEQLYVDSVYYSDKQVPLTGYVIGDVALPLLKPDSVNYVIVKLDNDFGRYLIRDQSKLFYGNQAEDFRSYFKGILFQILPGTDPAMLSLSLVPSAANGGYANYIDLFMHNSDNTPREVLFVLDAVNKNASFNTFTHDFSSAVKGNITQVLNKVTEPASFDTLSYLQYLDGAYTKIVIPGLENLKNNPDYKNIAVNKARVTVPVLFDGDIYKPSTVPSQLFLRYESKDGIKTIVPDYSISPGFFDGTLDSTANVYHFNIPAFIQDYFDDATNSLKPELEIFQFEGTKNVILKANGSKTPVKFEFTYTKF